MEIKVKSFSTSISNEETDKVINDFIEKNNIQEIKSLTKMLVTDSFPLGENVWMDTTIVYVEDKETKKEK